MTDASVDGDMLASQLALRLEPTVPVRRMRLNEVNATTVEHALATASSIDWNAIDEIEARLAIRRLFSATLSPLVLRSGLRAGVSIASFPAVRRLVARERLRMDEGARGVGKTARHTVFAHDRARRTGLRGAAVAAHQLRGGAR